MTNIQEDLLRSQLKSLQDPKNLTNLGDLIKKLGILIKAAKPFIRREGYEVKVTDLEHDGKMWSAILTRKLKQR